MQKTDILNESCIRLRLLDKYKGARLIIEETVGSTNDLAKMHSTKGAGHGTLITAHEQTSGRGRRSRTFHSPAGAGLYMSVILKPKLKHSDMPLVTMASALAVCRAIMQLTGFSPKIKWVNDIFLNGKKICGILTEAVADPDTGDVACIISGIGVNVSIKDGDFPEELRHKAGSLYPSGEPDITRNMLAAAIMNELLELCEGQKIERREFIDDYRMLSFIPGREIRYMLGNEQGVGQALEIDDDGCLLVRSSENGEIITLNSGEVSIVEVGG